MAIKTTGKLRKIPETRSIHAKSLVSTKRRVCGYARVSTDHDEQQLSFDSQKEYYTNLIRNNSSWEYVGLYSDEGISATNLKHRDGFNRMINDALSGKIDLIITKSISRFARNTVDSLTTIRNLKAHNVEVFFEKENIMTFDSKGELMISLLSSLAQDESRNISENSTWGIRKRFADGFVRMRYYNFLGYEQDNAGRPKIVEKEARTIRLIYKLFMEGNSYRGIARKLTSLKIKSPGNTDIWRDNTVKSILTNERYCGDALLQKRFTVDFLTKKSKKNEGEVPQYYIENDHKGIVSKELFNAVQDEVKKRSANYRTPDPIGSKIYCGYCNSNYGKKVWHSTDIYKKEIYQCNHKFSKDKDITNVHKAICDGQNLTIEMIQDLFVKEFNQYISKKTDVIDNVSLILDKLPDEKELLKELDKKRNEIEELTNTINNEIYQGHNVDTLISDYEELKVKVAEMELKYNKTIDSKNRLKIYIKDLKSGKTIKEFSIEYWNKFLDRMIVYKDKIEVKFLGG